MEIKEGADYNLSKGRTVTVLAVRKGYVMAQIRSDKYSAPFIKTIVEMKEFILSNSCEENPCEYAKPSEIKLQNSAND